MTIFERYPKTTLSILVVLLSCATLFALEKTAQHFGLGTVVLYESNPIYGYRPKPNQDIVRFQNARIKINNLGLRAQEDWDDNPQGKVLFLGDSVTYGGSYVDNQDLFTTLAVKDLSLQAGNAGVNAWGILNIHALVKEAGFMPAQYYITLVPEGDFYRGLNRLGGLPFWSRPTQSALEELFYYGLYKLYLKKTPGVDFSVREGEEVNRLVNIAARDLKAMDDALKAQGYDHLIVISPTLNQALGLDVKDSRVEKALNHYGIEPIYLVDLLDQEIDPAPLFHDTIHLTPEGHAVWGRLLKAVIETHFNI